MQINYILMKYYIFKMNLILKKKNILIIIKLKKIIFIIMRKNIILKKINK